MSIKELEVEVIRLKHQRPFRPFEVELRDGQVLEIRQSNLSINETGAGYLSEDDGIVDFDFADVRELRPLNRKNSGTIAMKVKELEERMIQFKHQKPFRPFEVELLDGRVIKVKRPSLMIDNTGAGYHSDDEGIVDFEFSEVRCFRPLKKKASR